MSHQMRRAKQQLTDRQAQDILASPSNTHGVLAVNGIDGFPYCMPVSFAWADGKIWLHHAKAGQRLECLSADNRMCFTVVDADDIDQEGYTSDYASVIVYGRAHCVETDELRYFGLKAIMDKYAPDMTEEFRHGHAADCTRADVWFVEPERITGKAGKALMKTRFAQP